MLIADKRNNKTEKFGNANISECFEYGGTIYMKTDVSGASKNAWNFSKSVQVTFLEHDLVIPVKTELHILE